MLCIAASVYMHVVTSIPALYALPQSNSAAVVLQPELEVIASEQDMTMDFKFVSSTSRTEGVVNISDALQSKAFQNEVSTTNQYVIDIWPWYSSIFLRIFLSVLL